ncbi:lytic murein transglycosylase [Alteromonas halophila]|uniref:Murein transglycosylase n=1 Tax=Alteromonas halophila TaxID=516698 RepID=A0A918N1L3_9ALTE|nr:lytic murein transglycosylase [Alteromonas halophila]GGW94874.1 murein transglycosylase [Alteromonas halophila]
MKRLIVICVLLLTSGIAHTKEKTEAGFRAYVASLKQQAQDKGFSQAWLDTTLTEMAFRPTVIASDKNQPERKTTLDDYLATRVPDWKVEQAVEKLASRQDLLDEIGTKYGVQPRFIVALWGNESNFGRIQGNHDVLSALASLAYEGRREALFKKQFFAALTILNEGHIDRQAFNGSWAGAMGQSQFMPTSFLTYAVDYDGDGKKDIWGTEADVFASIANFLASEGWNDALTWGRQVKVQGDPNTLSQGLSHQASLADWQQSGVRRYNGNNLPTNEIDASLIMPDGPDGRIYLVYDNFRTLMRWNRSLYFGVSVGYLSDRIKRGY